MRTLKILLIILIALAVLILVGIALVWKELAFERTIQPHGEAIELEGEGITDNREGNMEPTEEIVPLENSFTSSTDTTFVVSTSDLPQGQREVIGTLGLEETEFTITQGMVLCAIDSLGEARVMALKEGDTPSIAEGLTLIACSRK